MCVGNPFTPDARRRSRGGKVIVNLFRSTQPCQSQELRRSDQNMLVRTYFICKASSSSMTSSAEPGYSRRHIKQRSGYCPLAVLQSMYRGPVRGSPRPIWSLYVEVDRRELSSLLALAPVTSSSRFRARRLGCLSPTSDPILARPIPGSRQLFLSHDSRERSR
jgi:hypothetical protein